MFREESEGYGSEVAREGFLVPKLKIKRVAGAFDQDEFVFYSLTDESSGQGPRLADIDRAINEAMDDEHRRRIFRNVSYRRGEGEDGVVDARGAEDLEAPAGLAFAIGYALGVGFQARE